LLPTPEIKQKFHLGIFVKKNAQKGRIVSQETWDAGYVDNWHQGSAIVITSPTVSDYSQVLGNYIENTGSNQQPDAVVSPTPKFKYAVTVASDVRGLHFSNNLFQSGTVGVSNVVLPR